MTSEKILEERRRKMVSLIREEGIRDRSVLNAMLKVPRHLFVNRQIEDYAYINSALPIEHSQTISQPYIVAFMTQEARLNPESKVLEIGTGSGYQAAILAEICKEVFTIEIIEQLVTKASILLKNLGYHNIHTKVGTGYLGWEDKMPFDAIIVTAVADSLPESLLKQLTINGCIIIPIKRKGNREVLVRIIKISDKKYVSEDLLDVHFVPLVHSNHSANGVNLRND
jgi:protein-L-isoaspartate(D-aspartate) O-methyltransferase